MYTSKTLPLLIVATHPASSVTSAVLSGIVVWSLNTWSVVAGVVVPIPTLPSALRYIREIFPDRKSAIAFADVVFTTFTQSPKFAVLAPSIHPAKFASAIVRFTSREAAGAMVPIPTFPELRMVKK